MCRFHLTYFTGRIFQNIDNCCVQLGKDFGLDFALERGQILIYWEVKSTHSLWPRV